MGLRPAKTFRDGKKVAWARYSRRKPRKSFVKSMPHNALAQFVMGNPKGTFEAKAEVLAKELIMVRDNALKSARQAINKSLEKALPNQYHFRVLVFPHNVIRENKMIAGAGADRLQKGMRQAFGRPTDRAARLKIGTDLFTVYSYKANAAHMKMCLVRAMHKISGRYRITIGEPSVVAVAA